MQEVKGIIYLYKYPLSSKPVRVANLQVQPLQQITLQSQSAETGNRKQLEIYAESKFGGGLTRIRDPG